MLAGDFLVQRQSSSYYNMVDEVYELIMTQLRDGGRSTDFDSVYLPEVQLSMT